MRNLTKDTMLEVTLLLERLYRMMVELTNGKWSSLLLKSFAQSNLSRWIIPPFAKVYNINQADMANPIHHYPTLHDFFIRQLKEGVRPIDGHADAIVSPVDCSLEDVGPITKDRMIRVKGKAYSVENMLGDSQVLEKYIGGHFMVLYLSPSHYHRIHSPITGTITKQWSLGSKSYPVNRAGLKYGKETLSGNYRMITEIAHEKGTLALVKVGAMFVNSIETTHEHDHLVKGSELAYFTFGSTVVLLFEKGKIEFTIREPLPQPLKVGERIARFL